LKRLSFSRQCDEDRLRHVVGQVTIARLSQSCGINQMDVALDEAREGMLRLFFNELR